MCKLGTLHAVRLHPVKGTLPGAALRWLSNKPEAERLCACACVHVCACVRVSVSTIAGVVQQRDECCS